MKRNTLNCLFVLIGICLFSITGYGAKLDKSVTDKILYENFYIGEFFSSGFIYIEPFRFNREAGEEGTIKFSGYPKKIKFYPCYQDRVKFYDATFDSVFKMYVPGVEKESGYFSAPASEAKQFGLRYKTGFTGKEVKLGIALLNLNVSKIDYNVKGKKRPYSVLEYNKAQNEVKKDREIDDSERTTDYITLESIIVGAKQILKIHLNDSPLTIRLSEYFTHGFEYAAYVYVMDILKDEKVIKTYEKYNWDGPV